MEIIFNLWVTSDLYKILVKVFDNIMKYFITMDYLISLFIFFIFGFRWWYNYYIIVNIFDFSRYFLNGTKFLPVILNHLGYFFFNWVCVVISVLFLIIYVKRVIASLLVDAKALESQVHFVNML